MLAARCRVAVGWLGPFGTSYVLAVGILVTVGLATDRIALYVVAWFATMPTALFIGTAVFIADGLAGEPLDALGQTAAAVAVGVIWSGGAAFQVWAVKVLRRDIRGTIQTRRLARAQRTNS